MKNLLTQDEYWTILLLLKQINRRNKMMVYVERYTEAQATALVVELKEEGYRAYFTKNNTDSFTVQYWK